MLSRWYQRMKYLASSTLFQLPNVSWNWSNLQACHSKTDGWTGKLTSFSKLQFERFPRTFSKSQFWEISKSWFLNNCLNKVSHIINIEGVKSSIILRETIYDIFYLQNDPQTIFHGSNKGFWEISKSWFLNSFLSKVSHIINIEGVKSSIILRETIYYSKTCVLCKKEQTGQCILNILSILNLDQSLEMS